MDKLKEAHKKSFRNRSEIEKSSICGCFQCRSVFLPSDIYEWTDKRDTALCPVCGIDSVIGDASGFSISEEFLREMEKYWFSR